MKTFLHFLPFISLFALASQPSAAIAREEIASVVREPHASSRSIEPGNALLTTASEKEERPVRIITKKSISGPAGSHTVRGALVTYTISAHIEGMEPISDFRLSSPIDPKAQYVSGSLRLNGNLLTDANDHDEGRASNQRIDVALAEAPAGSVYEVAYTVMITG